MQTRPVVVDGTTIDLITPLNEDIALIEFADKTFPSFLKIADTFTLGDHHTLVGDPSSSHGSGGRRSLYFQPKGDSNGSHQYVSSGPLFSCSGSLLDHSNDSSISKILTDLFTTISAESLFCGDIDVMRAVASSSACTPPIMTFS